MKERDRDAGFGDGTRDGDGPTPAGAAGAGGTSGAHDAYGPTASREEAPGRGRTEAAAVCELCGGPVLERHCKVLCLNCGFQRDCSDP